MARGQDPVNKLPIPPRDELVNLYLDQWKSFAEIGRIYNTSNSTVMRWCRLYGIPARPQHFTYQVKTLKGVPHRQCKGPLHSSPAWVPFDGFIKLPDGQPRSHCRMCEFHSRGSEPTVEFDQRYRMWVQSIIRRIGLMEAARRMGISDSTISDWQHRPPPRIKRRNARKIVILLAELRETQEVRHRKSIKHGAKLRGHEERPVIRQRDLLFSEGDRDQEKRQLELERRKARRRAQRAAQTTPQQATGAVLADGEAAA